MKKVWYLDGKENKKKKTVKLFVYEKEKVPTAHLDLSAFAELAQYDDWIIRFFHKDTSVLKEILYKKDSAFLKEALAGKGILDADTAALLQRNRKDLELCIRAGLYPVALDVLYMNLIKEKKKRRIRIQIGIRSRLKNKKHT